MFVSLGCRKIVRRAAPKGLKKSDVVWALEKVVLSAVPYHSPPRFPPAASPRQVPPDLPPVPACGGPPPFPPLSLQVPRQVSARSTRVGLENSPERYMGRVIPTTIEYTLLFFTHFPYHPQPHYSYVFSYCSSVILHLYLSIIYSTVY
jgi:hypothetical protein